MNPFVIIALFILSMIIPNVIYVFLVKRKKQKKNKVNKANNDSFVSRFFNIVVFTTLK